MLLLVPGELLRMRLPQHEKVLVLDLEEAVVLPERRRLAAILLLENDLSQVESVQQSVQYFQAQGDDGAVPSYVPDEDTDGSAGLETPEYLESDVPHFPDVAVDV